MNLREFAQNHLAKSKVAQRPDNQALLRELAGDAEETREASMPSSMFNPSKLLELPREEPYQIGSEEKLNKTEREYLEWLRTLGDARIWVQAITLEIGHKCTYKADFAAMDHTGMRFIDTKASWNKGKTPHVEDDAMCKIKVCARLYAPMRFLIAWKGRNGTWQHKEVMP